MTIRACILSLLVLLTLAVGAAEPAAAPADYRFAVWLYDQREYFRAVTEFKRYEFDLGTPEAAQRGETAVAVCYQRAREWARARDAWRGLLARFPDDAHAPEYAYRMGECLVGGGEFATGAAVLAELVKRAPAADPFADDAQFLLGSAHLAQGALPEALAAYRAYLAAYPQGALAPAAHLFITRLPRIAALRRKSPALAGLLSAVVPGLGQVYAGRARDGLTALLVNAGMAALTYKQFDARDTTGGVVLAGVGSTLYFGNIYGAANAAVKANARQQETQLDALVREAQPRIKSLGHPERLVPPAL
jgi:tetratricopeptide (TPR) repeat protein